MNDWRDKIEASLSTARLGSDGSNASEIDTGVKSLIAGTTENITNTKFNKGIKVSYVSSIGGGSGSAARECDVVNSTGVSVLRVVYPEIDLVSTSQVEVDTQIIMLQEL